MQKTCCTPKQRQQADRTQSSTAFTHPFLNPLPSLSLFPSALYLYPLSAISLSSAREKESSFLYRALHSWGKSKGISGNWCWQEAAAKLGLDLRSTHSFTSTPQQLTSTNTTSKHTHTHIYIYIYIYTHIYTHTHTHTHTPPSNHPFHHIRVPSSNSPLPY